MPKLMEATRVSYNDVEYAIFPFPAMVSTGIVGDLAKYIGPIVSALMPLMSGDLKGTNIDEIGMEVMDNVMKRQVDELVPVLQSAFRALDGESLQKIVKSLLIENNNISYEYVDDNGRVITRRLTASAMDELFIGNLNVMVKLCIDVVRVNFTGFFGNRLSRSGGQRGKSKDQKSASMERSMDVVSVL